MQLRLTPAVKGLLIACFAGFIIQQTADQFFGGRLLSWFGLIPAKFILEHHFWQIVTYAFLHGDVMHLFLNLLMLVFIGSELEAVWGKGLFLRYYFFCLMSAGLVYLLMQAFVWGGSALHVPMVGASGAIYGLLMAFGLIFGERTLLFMMLFPMKAKYFVWILGAIEFMSGVYSGKSGLASVAHLTGMAAGFGFLWVRASLVVMRRKREAGGMGFGLGKSSGKSRKAKPRKSSHLKLVIDNARENAGRPGHDQDEDADDSGPKTWH